MYPRSSEYPWVNAKGSDVTLLLRFICVQCTGFLNALLHPTHDRYMMLIRDTSSAGIKFSAGLHAHGLESKKLLNGFASAPPEFHCGLHNACCVLFEF